MKRSGTLNIFDTHVGVWEETVTDGMLPVLDAAVRHFRSRGWRMQVDAEIAKSFPSLKRSSREGKKGDLRVKLQSSGRHLEIQFFQDVVTQNKCGGYYDFDKLTRATKASRFLRLMCLAEMVALARWLEDVGYHVGVRDGFSKTLQPVSAKLVRDLAEQRTGTPLEHFNSKWGSDRFERGPSGWPALPEYRMCGWNQVDGDGVQLEQGAWRFNRGRCDGRLRYGQVFGGINGLWWFVSNDQVVSFANHAKEFFSSAEGEPRRLVARQLDRLEKELRKATEARQFARVAELGRVLDRLTVSEAA